MCRAGFSYILESTGCKNLSVNKELLTLVIISFILVALAGSSRVIL